MRTARLLALCAPPQKGPWAPRPPAPPHLDVRHRGAQAAVPVDEAVVAVDHPRLVHAHKRLEHRGLVGGEGRERGRGAEVGAVPRSLGRGHAWRRGRAGARRAVRERGALAARGRAAARPPPPPGRRPLTARVSSMVNTWRLQSTLLPMRRSWSQMRPPYSSTHLYTSPRNGSRPGGRRRRGADVGAARRAISFAFWNSRFFK
jgi:hypothetical protein